MTQMRRRALSARLYSFRVYSRIRIHPERGINLARGKTNADRITDHVPDYVSDY